jgi:hypothetical protein
VRKTLLEEGEKRVGGSRIGAVVRRQHPQWKAWIVQVPQDVVLSSIDARHPAANTGGKEPPDLVELTFQAE